MKESIVYSLNTLYRDTLRVRGYEFGSGTDKSKSVCVMGALRGNEVQQLYVCGLLVKELKALERTGAVADGSRITVIPCGNPRSINTEKKFWPIDNTDINRMFPGYDKGETTQRIAAGLFEAVKDYTYGIQLASFYMPGRFVPHVRMMSTGEEDVEQAKLFGLPYVVRRKVKPYETTTLNYNWQLWETKAYSVYTATTATLDERSAMQGQRAILNFLKSVGILSEDAATSTGYRSRVLMDTDMVCVRNTQPGIYRSIVQSGQITEAGRMCAEIIDPYTGESVEKIYAPCAGTIFFSHDNPLVYADTAVIKIVPEMG